MNINAPDVALVFEGGGMRASYSSGVLNALLEAEIFTGWVGGISAGSSCSVNYLSRSQERSRKSFTDLVLHDQFGGFQHWLRGKGFFHSEWIYEQTSGPEEPLPYAFSDFQSNPTEFAIGGFRCDNGEMVYWTREDVEEHIDLMKYVRASSTMPILMPWTTINGVDYCDGALGPTGGFAHDAAQAAGYTKLIVVTTRPRHYVKHPQRASKAMQRLLRRYPAVHDGLMARAENYNRSREELLQMERDGQAILIFPEQMPITNSERNVHKLRAMYEQGLAHGRCEVPAIKEFVGL